MSILPEQKTGSGLEADIARIMEGPERTYADRRLKQDQLFQLHFADTKKLIVFVNFPENDFCGGVMTIFHFAELSRAMKPIHGCDVLHANQFSQLGTSYLRQPRFQNDEIIYSMWQVMEHAHKLDTLIFHVPELLMENFAKSFTHAQRVVLRKIKNLQINVLNQNVEVFSPLPTWVSLWDLTDNITQTTGFDRYTTQEICDIYGLPLYRLIGYCGLYKKIRKTPLEQKEKLIIYSPDPHPQKEEILRLLRAGLPDFKLQQIQDLTFDEFMSVAERAMFSLTFGEGFDGYFTNIHFAGGIGFSVYNETFFPSHEFAKFRTIYRSYDELADQLVGDIQHLMRNPEEFASIAKEVEALNVHFAYNENLTYALMEKFYRNEPTFKPAKSGRFKVELETRGTVLRPEPPSPPPPGPEAFLFEPEWAGVRWVEVLLSYFEAFPPGEQVALIMPLFGAGATVPEGCRQAVIELITATGRERFPDVVLLDGPEDLFETLRQYPLIHFLLAEGALAGEAAPGSRARRFTEARQRLLAGATP